MLHTPQGRRHFVPCRIRKHRKLSASCAVFVSDILIQLHLPAPGEQAGANGMLSPRGPPSGRVLLSCSRLLAAGEGAVRCAMTGGGGWSSPGRAQDVTFAAQVCSRARAFRAQRLMTTDVSLPEATAAARGAPQSVQMRARSPRRPRNCGVKLEFYCAVKECKCVCARRLRRPRLPC